MRCLQHRGDPLGSKDVDVEDVVQGPRRTERSRAGCDHDSSHVFASSRDCG
jgi:hypothetical protein